MIKLIACDLDGTTLDPTKQLDTELVKLIPELKKKGVELTFITGRNEEIVANYIDEAGIEIPYAINNGANIYQKHKCIENDCIEKEYNNYLANTLYDNDIACRLFTLEDIYAYSDTPFFKERSKVFFDIQKEYTNNVDLSENNLYKITADFRHHMENFEKIFEDILDHCPKLSFLKAENTVYCINSDTANKGNALKRICKLMNIDVSKTIVFGDNGTDIPMLEAAGVSVVVENGDEEAKRHAKYICCSNKESGVSTFIKEYFKL